MVRWHISNVIVIYILKMIEKNRYYLFVYKKNSDSICIRLHCPPPQKIKHNDNDNKNLNCN